MEITDYGTEFYTLDKLNEYDREKNWVIVGTISSQHNQRRNFELEVKNSEEWKFNTWWLPNVNFGKWSRKDNTVEANVWVWGGPILFMVTIPKQDQNASICCTIDGEKKEFTMADIVKRGEWGSQYESCRIDWENYLQQVDIAHRLNENSASFDVKLQSHRQYPIYQLRAVTSCGSIYRTPPILPVSLPNALTSLMVHSENKNEIVEVKVCNALLPLMQYKLVNQEYSGDLLTNNFDPFFNGKLGGGYSYGDAFNIFPLPKKNHAPQFVTDAEQPALKFDGSSYITFRQEAFPRGSFTLNFEIKPEAETNRYVLFRHSHHSPGSLVIYVDEEGMKLSYFDRNLKTQHFSSGLLIQPGEWSTISVSYNYNAITFKVNDNQKVIELDKPLLAMYFKPAIFGGHNQPKFGLPEGYEFYHGLMKNLEILHK